MTQLIQEVQNLLHPRIYRKFPDIASSASLRHLSPLPGASPLSRVAVEIAHIGTRRTVQVIVCPAANVAGQSGEDRAEQNEILQPIRRDEEAEQANWRNWIKERVVKIENNQELNNGSRTESSEMVPPGRVCAS